MIIEQTEWRVKYQAPARVDWIIASALSIAALILYTRTMAPGLLPGDAGEFQLSVWRLGLAHPTGYPLYMLVGHVWQRALGIFSVSPATALNGLSAVFAALSVGCIYLFMLQTPVSSAVNRRTIAVFSALLLTANSVFWSQALIAEVYTLQSLLFLLLLLALQRLETAITVQGQPAMKLARPLILVAFLFGLSMSHHAMSALLVPAILVYLWSLDRDWWRLSARSWLLIIAATILPLLLYAYIPLRSGPEQSPWLHQPFGDTTLTLYENSWSSFVAYITGQSISVGFNSLPDAMGELPVAARLWLDEFGVLGLLLMAFGIYVLAVMNRPLLWLTVVMAVTQQSFNLFYAIDDIAAYYIPLFIIGVIWAGYGIVGLAVGRWRSAGIAGRTFSSSRTFGTRIALLLCLMPIWHMWENFSLLDQSTQTYARTMWEEILAVAPDEPVIFISNDRDELPPLFYLQYVENRVPTITALHPLMTPDERFADIGATIDTALREGADTPVYLIKPMPGLDSKFVLSQPSPPLVRVHERPPMQPDESLDQDLGGLTLLGYDWKPVDGAIALQLYWLVESPLSANYTTSVQLFDNTDTRIAQSDRPAGGLYYPTSLWKEGEQLIEQHTLNPATPLTADSLTLQVGMYQPQNLQPLAEPLRIPVRTDRLGN